MSMGQITLEDRSPTKSWMSQFSSGKIWWMSTTNVWTRCACLFHKQHKQTNDKKLHSIQVTSHSIPVFIYFHIYAQFHLLYFKYTLIMFHLKISILYIAKSEHCFRFCSTLRDCALLCRLCLFNSVDSCWPRRCLFPRPLHQNPCNILQ